MSTRPKPAQAGADGARKAPRRGRRGGEFRKRRVNHAEGRRPDDAAALGGAVVMRAEKRGWGAWRAAAVLALVLFEAIGSEGGILAAAQEPARELSRSLEHQTFDLINQYRTDAGLPPLVWSPVIAEMARRHSQEMATGETAFGHGGFGDRMATLRGLFPGMTGGGENVFYTDDRPEVARFAVQGWLHSPPHLHNIRGNFQYSGLGLWRRADGACFFTQIFVRAGR